jgi:AmmeMemoRadiSam system protein A
MLLDLEREQLREIAMDAIRAELTGEACRAPLPAAGPLTEPGSAFVTLRKGGRLRGCIGMIGHLRPLALCVREAARRSLTDGRFHPVQPEELPELELEISVLTAFVPVSDVSEVEVGRHGLLVGAAGRSGLLLPQVAVEHGWDREAFLDHACLKAGLGPDEWRRPDLEIKVFEAQVF